MAGADGRDDPSLIGRLRAEPQRFDIRQAARLLDLCAKGSVPAGDGQDPAREAFTLRGSLGSSFPASDIEALTQGRDGRAHLTLAFMSLAGAFGPLPQPLTARVVDAARAGDMAARDFLDVFNHRLLSLLLRQLRLTNPALQDPSIATMPAKRPLLALLGLATLPRQPPAASIEGRLGDAAGGALTAAGLLHPRPLSAHALERLVAHHLGVPARVIPLRGGWLLLAPGQWTRLGRGAPLGRGAVLGTKVWDQGAGVWLDVGPAGADLLRGLLPGGAAHRALAVLVGLKLGAGVDVDIRVAVRAPEVPCARLGASVLGSGARLGWTAWLGRLPRREPGVARIRLQNAFAPGGA